MKSQKSITTAEELRGFARLDPEEAFLFIGNNIALWEKLVTSDPFDSADVIEEFDPEEAATLTEVLPTNLAINLFSCLRPRAVIDILEYLNTATATKIFESLDTEDTIDVLERSTEEESTELLNILSKSTRLNIDRRLAYPEDSVGRLMSEVVAMLDIKTTVRDSLLELKDLHNNIADLIYVYLVNDFKELVGVVSFRELVFAEEDMLIEEVMIQNPISVNVKTDQEEAARLIKQYELLALPVVDDSNKLIGQATVTDALDVIQQEIAEDFSQSFGAGAEENIFTPIKKSLSMRLPWITVNLILAFFVSYTVAQFQDSISTNALLAVLMPVVALVGGNSGAQSLAIVIRALAKNDISDARVAEVIWKQSMIGFLNGIFIALISMAILFAIDLSLYAIPLGVAVLFNIFIGNFSGATIPLLLRKLGFDPALASNIFLTLITDIVGFSGFLFVALLLL
tara:strand:- start:2658 stop:4025 length:1368 start_codon:yes stop_codon:yes gene_type:complete